MKNQLLESPEVQGRDGRIRGSSEPEYACRGARELQADYKSRSLARRAFVTCPQKPTS